MHGSVLAEGNYALRRMEDSADDFALLARWLSDERVLRFYEGRDHPFTMEMVKQKYGARVLTQDGVTPCIMLYEGYPIGYLQYYQADPQEYEFEVHGKIYALDLFIGEPAYWGRGLGPGFIRLLLCYLLEEKGADWVLLDPHIDNLRAIRCYEKCGFRKLKLLKAHELHEGKYVDCWLMGVRWNDQE